ncbi:MAG: hypothetical protein RLZZ46_1468 [Bacteroidota bacterium]|jgi:uncharacterized protein YprB with RNaseH-like and TPR domain
MLEQIKTETILFLDIETVAQAANFSMLPEQTIKLWNKKAGNLKREEQDTPESLYQRAGIYAEFGKIICICGGMLTAGRFRIKSFSGHDEKQLLDDFAALLNQLSGRNIVLCAHNGKEFDFPYISRRMLVNNIKIPRALDLAGKKPWEVPHLDTMELWKFGDFKSFTSLELLAHIFKIPTPKDDIDGSMVNDTYWKENDLERITAYCRKDVVTLARLLMKWKGEGELSENQIEIA